MRYKRGCDWSTIKGNLLGEENTFKVYLAFYWKDLTENSHLTLSAYAFQKKKKKLQHWLRMSNVMGKVLEDQSAFSSISQLTLEGFN
jgi:hypothetical protein